MRNLKDCHILKRDSLPFISMKAEAAVEMASLIQADTMIHTAGATRDTPGICRRCFHAAGRHSWRW